MNILEVRLAIELSHREDLAGLFGVSSLSSGTSVRLCDEAVEVRLLTAEGGFGFTDACNVEMLVSFALGVSSGVVANALFYGISKGLRRLLVDGRPVRPSAEDLERAIQTIQMLARQRLPASAADGAEQATSSISTPQSTHSESPEFPEKTR